MRAEGMSASSTGEVDPRHSRTLTPEEKAQASSERHSNTRWVEHLRCCRTPAHSLLTEPRCQSSLRGTQTSRCDGSRTSARCRCCSSSKYHQRAPSEAVAMFAKRLLPVHPETTTASGTDSYRCCAFPTERFIPCTLCTRSTHATAYEQSRYRHSAASQTSTCRLLRTNRCRTTGLHLQLQPAPPLLQSKTIAWCVSTALAAGSRSADCTLHVSQTSAREFKRRCCEMECSSCLHLLSRCLTVRRRAVPRRAVVLHVAGRLRSSHSPDQRQPCEQFTLLHLPVDSVPLLPVYTRRLHPLRAMHVPG